jgi:8-oxo-dGTP pyrophosphatase MutT (NUDIX family)
VLGLEARAAAVTPSAASLWCQGRPPSTGGRRLLWRRLPIALALTTRLVRLRERLAGYQPSTDDDTSLLWAAVAVILTPEPDSILLIRRAERTGDPWGGHMALPGGRREPDDEDLLGTAIRETWEEIGVQLEREHLAGTLDDVVPRTPVLPPVAVRPFVFLVPARPGLTLNAEVAEASWVGLDHLLHAGTHHPVRLDIAGDTRVVQAYQLENAIVWGMTERILTSLLQQIS